MLAHEKDKLLLLLAGPGCWCQGAEARDGHGDAVQYGDPAATAWDLTGAVCRLFGWKRALCLFPQIEEHLLPRPRGLPRFRRTEIGAMTALQDYNDRSDLTYDAIIGQLRAMPARRETQP